MKTQTQLKAEQYEIANTKSQAEYSAWTKSLSEDEKIMMDHGMTANEFKKRYGSLGVFSEAYAVDHSKN